MRFRCEMDQQRCIIVSKLCICVALELRIKGEMDATVISMLFQLRHPRGDDFEGVSVLKESIAHSEIP